MPNFWCGVGLVVASLFIGSNLGVWFHCFLQEAGHEELEMQLAEAEMDRAQYALELDAVCDALVRGG